ncbi:MAG: serine hydrolase [Patescibacteria group bacterium]
MIFKMIGQFLFATAIMQMMPADAAFLEYQAGATDEYQSRVTQEEMSRLTEVLPEAETRDVYPIKVDRESYGIVTTAESLLVTDAASGMILLAKHPDEVRSIGSVTKLMAALVFLEQEPDLTQVVSLESRDLVEGGRIYLSFNTGIVLEDIFGASIVGSDNTATESLVRFSGLSMDDFVARMNDKAQELGMTSSTFTDPTGIRSSNTSTARDLVVLLEEAEKQDKIRKFMQTAVLYVPQSNGITVTIENTNQLLGSFLNETDHSIIGGKTGYLPEAGYVLATTVQEGEDRVHVVIMGSESKETRVREAKGLATWAFKVFKWPGEM